MRQEHEPRGGLVVLTGATKNFFKVGHAMVHHLAKAHPGVRVRLALPEIDGARRACVGTDVELFQWDRDEPESLRPAFDGATGFLLVPPIQRRVEVARPQLAFAQDAGVERVVCIGIQHTDEALAISREALELQRMLDPLHALAVTLHLPMFMENLLYQRQRVKDRGEVAFPCPPDARFSYVTCSDVGPVCAELLVSAGDLPRSYRWATGQVSCAEIVDRLSDVVGRRVTFRSLGDREFTDELRDMGMSVGGARRVLSLWERIREGSDFEPDDSFRRFLGRDPESASEWLQRHRCCFDAELESTCAHPQPPLAALSATW